MIRSRCGLVTLVLMLAAGTGGAAGDDRVTPGERCTGAPGSAARARTALLGRLRLVREHGCSRSSETTSLAAEIRLELNGDTARLIIESLETLGGGPSPGRFRQGARDFFTSSTRRRWVYAGAIRHDAGKMIVALKSRESAEDRSGGERLAERKQEPVALELSCTPAAIGVATARAGAGEQVACRSVWLCRGLRELIPMAYESMSQLATAATVDGALPVAAAPGIEVSASDRMGRPGRSFRTPASSISR